MTSGYETFTKQPWSDLANASAATSSFLLLLFRVFGTYNVAVGVLGIGIASTAFRRGEAWAWWTLLVGNTVAYGSAMTYDRTVGFIGPFEMLEYTAGLCCREGNRVSAVGQERRPEYRSIPRPLP